MAGIETESDLWKRDFHAVVIEKFLIGGLSSSVEVTSAYLMALCDVNNIKVIVSIFYRIILIQ